MDGARALLRHGLATLAYRAAKTLRDAPEGFATFSLPRSGPGDAVRTPVQVLVHMGDLLDWSLAAASAAEGRHDPARSRLRPHLSEDPEIRASVSASVGGTPPPAKYSLEWRSQVVRFFESLQRLDSFLASAAESATTPARLLQGPIADAFTHVGQLAMLRRQFGSPIAPESFFDADIAIGRVDFDQPPPRT